MNAWELTDKERTEAIVKATLKTTSPKSAWKAIEQASRYRLMQWLHEPCYKHDAGLLRLGCPECLRELRKEVGL